MPPRTRKPKPSEAPVAVAPRPVKLDASTVSWNAQGVCVITYTDKQGAQHKAECAMTEIREATRALAIANGGGHVQEPPETKPEPPPPPLDLLPKGRDLLLHVLSKVRVLGMTKAEEAHIIQAPGQPHVFRVVATSRDGNRDVAIVSAKEIARLGEGEVIEIDEKGGKRVVQGVA